MALIYEATLSPSKLELLNAWLPSRPWAWPGSDDLSQIGAYRFDDPAGQVGMEGFVLLPRRGAMTHVPLSYRAAPLPGAEDHLVGTTEHSVLGTRWVYDACADPVWVTALATAVLTGGTQADEVVDSGDGRPEPREPSMTVQGSGASGAVVPPLPYPSCVDDAESTVITAGGLRLHVVRRIGIAPGWETAATLDGRWGPDLAAGAELALVTTTGESS